MRLLLQESDTSDSRALAEELQKIEQYVEMVLCYLRLSADSTDFLFREYDLDAIVRQAVRRYASQFIKKKLRLRYEPLGCTVLTDEKWLLFVIEQVLSNAIKYTPSGFIEISLERPRVLCIRDTGIGIDPADLPRIFETGFTGGNGRLDKRGHRHRPGPQPPDPAAAGPHDLRLFRSRKGYHWSALIWIMRRWKWNRTGQRPGRKQSLFRLQ